jgi:hypothetical protein
MKIVLSKAGEIRFEKREERTWNVSVPGDPNVFQSTIFAGEQMIAYGTEDDDIDDNGKVIVSAPFTLSYCGFKAVDFATMEEAKAAAPDFAREVLKLMLAMI